MTATLAERMKRVLRADVQGLHGYAVQPSAGMVKVDTMENPFQLPAALEAHPGIGSAREQMVDVVIKGIDERLDKTGKE